MSLQLQHYYQFRRFAKASAGQVYRDSRGNDIVAINTNGKIDATAYAVLNEIFGVFQW